MISITIPIIMRILEPIVTWTWVWVSNTGVNPKIRYEIFRILRYADTIVTPNIGYGYGYMAK